ELGERAEAAGLLAALRTVGAEARPDPSFASRLESRLAAIDASRRKLCVVALVLVVVAAAALIFFFGRATPPSLPPSPSSSLELIASDPGGEIAHGGKRQALGRGDRFAPGDRIATEREVVLAGPTGRIVLGAACSVERLAASPLETLL